MAKALIPAAISLELASIAERILNVPVLEAQMHDRLDFHELAVWEIKAALEAAYLLGKADQNT